MVPEGTDCSGFRAFYQNADGEYVPLELNSYCFGEMVLPGADRYPQITDVVGSITAGAEYTIQFRRRRGRRGRRAWRRSMRKLKALFTTKEVLA